MGSIQQQCDCFGCDRIDSKMIHLCMRVMKKISFHTSSYGGKEGYELVPEIQVSQTQSVGPKSGFFIGTPETSTICQWHGGNLSVS
jgi:hypothetical protein